jgi:hypothetical protein
MWMMDSKKFTAFVHSGLVKLGRLLLLSLFLSLGGAASLSSLAWAQGGSISGQTIQPSPPVGTGGPAANASILICPSTSSGTPCSPVAPIFSDSGLTQALPNPTNSDANGNYSIFVSPGYYIVQITPIFGNSLVYPYLVFVGSGTVSSVTLLMPSIFSLNSGSGCVITSSGTCNVTLVSQAPNLIFGSPSGVAGFPLFRSLGAPDFGTQPANTVLGNCTGVLAVPTFCPLIANQIPSTLNATSFSGNVGITGTLSASGKATLPGGASIFNPTFNGGKPWYDVTDPVYGAKCDGVTDDTTAFQSALTAANVAGGGTVFVPATAAACIIAGQLVEDQFISVQLVGGRGLIFDTIGQNKKPQLIFTGSSSPLISAKSSAALLWSGLNINYSNASFTGNMFDLSHTGSGCGGSGCDTFQDRFENLSLRGSASAHGAACLIYGDKSDANQVDNLEMGYATVAICGKSSGSSYATVWQISRSVFNGSLGPMTTFILNPDQGWEMRENTFEVGNNSGTNISGSVIDMTVGGCGGCYFSGNWIGDGAGYTGILLKNIGGSSAGTQVGGLSVTGNYFDSSLTVATLASFQATPINSAAAFAFSGNSIQVIGTAFAFYSGSPGSSNVQIDIAGNQWGSAPATAFMTGAPGQGRIADYLGRTFFYGPTGSSDSGGFGSNQLSNAAACETSFGITTLSTGGTTTNTSQSCLPSTAIIDAVVYRITTTITTAASFTIGDSTTAARFCGTQSILTAGTTNVCFTQADQTGAAGPRQVSASPVRITTNANPGAGAMRLIVYFHTWTAPQS